MNLSPLAIWFRELKRDLPWRNNPTPYAVWISEMMLQQTQVKTVIPYFERWMIRFPDVETLANASIEEVIKLWEGLGYYSRARYIHESARKLVALGFKTITEEALPHIKGLGPYTRGALLSFAFKKRAAAVDGNVLRVMSRLSLFEGDVSSPRSREHIEKVVLHALPQEKPWETMEALIELGATLCKKNPECLKCPLLGQCKAFKQGKQLELPVKKKGPAITKLDRTVLIIESERGFLVKKGKKGKIMADLYEFPWIEGHDEMKVEALILEQFGEFTELTKLEKVSHGFTRYQATLFPYRIRLKSKYSGEYDWHNDLEALPFSSGHKRIRAFLTGSAR